MQLINTAFSELMQVFWTMKPQTLTKSKETVQALILVLDTLKLCTGNY